MDQIEMYWKCDACGTINGGLSKKCGKRIVQNGKVVQGVSGGCGKAQDREEWFMPGDISKAANLTDDDDIAQAKAGADWFCGYCGSTQRRLDGECANCGGNHSFATEDRSGKVSFEDADLECTGSEKFSYTQNKNPKPSRLRPAPTRSPRWWPPRLHHRIWPWVAGSVGVAVLATFLVWLLTPRYVDAQVTAVSWTSTVSVERYQIVRDEGWDAPGDAFDVYNEGKRIHHYDHVRVGSHQESYQERVACGQDCRSESVPRVCTSNKNGTASCTGGGTRQVCSTRYCNETRYRTVDDYEDQPRYREWYSWRAWRWRHNRNVINTGLDLDPKPPTDEKIALNRGCTGNEKERYNTSWEYINKFDYVIGEKSKSYQHKTIDLGEFRRYPIGTSCVLKITGLGTSIKECKSG